MVEAVPHRKGPAVWRHGAGFCICLQTGNRGQGAFGQAQDIANLIFSRLPHKTVAAALSLSAFHKTGFGQVGHDGLQILLRDILTLRHLL